MRIHATPELLSPAGSLESLRAALAGGADAVYFGGAAFSNRMRAKNFQNTDMADTLRLIHACGAKAYVTVNTRVRERENDELDELLEAILGGREACDAIICADFGVAARIRRQYPSAVLHASTQTSLSSPADGEFLKELGFTRLVLPRELSLEEIRHIADRSPLEVEMFLHGAHCVSLSGQCLLSYFMGGRSGNRGECAQPCRLPYQVNGKTAYPLSLSDMCLAGVMTDVIASGAASLKIEGRLKPAPYVYGVTRLYRTLLDENRCADKKEIDFLASLFTRGFTDGFFTGAYKTMSGKSGEERNTATFADDIRRELGRRLDTHKRQSANDGKIPLRAHFSMKAVEPVTLTLTDGQHTVTAHGSAPKPADGSSLTPDAAAKNLLKFGSTSYTLSPEHLSADMEDGLWMAASELNGLRRDAAALLDQAREANPADAPVPFTPKKRTAESIHLKKPDHTETTAEFALTDVLLTGNHILRDALNQWFDRIYVPVWDVQAVLEHSGLDKDKLCAVLPPLTPSDEGTVELLKKLSSLPSSRVLCHTPGQAKLAKKLGFTADISFRANIWNREAMAVYRTLTDGTVMLSPELPAGAVCDLGGGLTVYGRIPAMTMGRCMICRGQCPKGNRGGRMPHPHSPKPHRCMVEITDRKGEHFPVIGQGDCTNILYNSIPVWMADKLRTLPVAEVHHYLFTAEAPEDILSVLEGYRSYAPGTGRRI